MNNKICQRHSKIFRSVNYYWFRIFDFIDSIKKKKKSIELDFNESSSISQRMAICET